MDNLAKLTITENEDMAKCKVFAKHEHRDHAVAAARDDQGQVRLHSQALHHNGINLGLTNRMDSRVCKKA